MISVSYLVKGMVHRLWIKLQEYFNILYNIIGHYLLELFIKHFSSVSFYNLVYNFYFSQFPQWICSFKLIFFCKYIIVFICQAKYYIIIEYYNTNISWILLVLVFYNLLFIINWFYKFSSVSFFTCVHIISYNLYFIIAIYVFIVPFYTIYDCFCHNATWLLCTALCSTYKSTWLYLVLVNYNNPDRWV